MQAAGEIVDDGSGVINANADVDVIDDKMDRDA